MRQITEVIVHCSDSSFGDVAAIRQWHTAPPPKGRGWKDIGYHFVVLNGHRTPHTFASQEDGLMEAGRPVEEIGAHCEGHNAHSIGICLVGKDNFTANQVKTLLDTLAGYVKQYGLPVSAVIGHCETDTGKAQGKTCPNMDMQVIRTALTGRLAQGA